MEILLFYLKFLKNCFICIRYEYSFPLILLHNYFTSDGSYLMAICGVGMEILEF